MKRENLADSSTVLRSQTLRRWQNRWSEERRGRWTGRLIPSIRASIQRNFWGNYFLTQNLSGHGYFRQYLYRMSKAIDPGCIYCEEMSDDSEHTFFHCIKRQDERNMLIEQLVEITSNNIVNAMLESETKCSTVRRFVECVLPRKKVDLDTIRRNDT